MWQILLKKKSFTKYLNITDYLSSNISINSKLSTQLKTFDLSFSHIQDLDGNRIKIELGDRIVITKDESLNEVIVFGRVKKPNQPILYWNEDKNIWEQNFDINCREPNFAIDRVTEIYQNQLLSNILSDLLNKASNLGGVSTTLGLIEKFKLICSDMTIPYFQINNKSLLDAISQLCKENNLFFRIDYFSEPNEIETIKIFSQLIIMDENGETAPEPYNIIDDEKFFSGLLSNPNWSEGSTTEPRYLYGFTLPATLENDGDDIKNDLCIQAKVLDSSGTMERYTPDVIDGQSSYILPTAANEIYYVSNNKLIGCYILSTPTPTTTEFYINKAQIIHMKTGDILRIVSTDQTYENFRTISSLNNSTGKVTINLPLSFTPSGNELVEIAHNTPIYEEGNPVLAYERTGCIIRTSSTDKASIEFLPFSIPGRPNKLCVYYSKLNTRQIRQINEESKEDYELSTFDYEIKKPITIEQLQEIQRKSEQNNLNDSFSVKAFLPIIPKCGWNTQINLTDVLNKNLRLNSVKSKYWATQEEDYYNLDIIEHTLEYANKNNSFETYLKNLERTLEISSLSVYPEKIRKVTENLSISEIITITKNLPAPLLLDPTEISNDGFRVNYTPTPGAVTHKLDVSIYPDFSSMISGYNQKNILATGTWLVNGLHEIIGTNTFYYRLRGLPSEGQYSTYSTVGVINREVDLQKDSYTTLALNFSNNYNDDSGNGNNATGINSPSFTTALLSGDTASVQLDGINDVIQLPNAVSTSRTMTVRAVFKYLSFTRSDTYLYSEWYGQAANFNYKAKIILEYDKSNNRFLINLYDESYGATPNNHQYALLSVNLTLNTINKNLIQFSWNNTTKTAKFCCNNTEYTLSQIGGTIPISVLNLKDTISPHEIFWGGMMYPNTLNTSLSPNMVLAKLYVDNGIARDLAYHQQDWTNISIRF